MRDLLQSKQYPRISIVATLYFIDYLLRLPKEHTEKLSREIGTEIRKERKLMELFNEDNASPTVANSFAERLDLMEARLDRELEKGMEKGIEQGVKQVAIKMIEKGRSNEEIMIFTDLTLEQIETLRLEQ